jgi:hypothetical protein
VAYQSPTEEWRDKSETVQKLDTSQAFLKLVQYISDRARPKMIEGGAHAQV